MTLLVEKGTFTKTTSTSTPVSQQVNLQDSGLTPKLLILWTNEQTTEATYAENHYISFGFSDGTNDACQTLAVEDNDTVNVSGYSFNDNCILSLHNDTTPTATAQVSRCDVTSFNAGNFVLNWSVQSNTDAKVIHYIVAGGTDITNVKVVSTTKADTATGAHTFNGAGFQPDFVLAMTGGDGYTSVNTIGTAATVGAGIGLGAAVSSSKEFCLFARTEPTAGTADTDMDLHNNATLLSLDPANGAETYLADFTSFAADGITLNVSNGATSASERLAFLFVKGGAWDVGTFQQRSGTGTQDVTLDASLDPSIVFLTGINSATANALVANNYLGIGASDGTREGCIWCGDQNGATTMVNTRVNHTTKVYRQATPNATAGSSTTNAECDMNDMATAGKFQLSWTTASATLHQMGFWVLGTVPAGTTYERSPSTETVTISEASLTRALSAARIPSSDTTTIDETLTRATQAFRAPSTDSTTIGESLSGGKLLERAPSADTTAIADSSLTRLLSAARSIEDTETIGETLSRTTQAFRSVEIDSTTIGESLSGGKLLERAPSADTTTITDASLTRLLSAARVPDNDIVSVTEASLTRLLSAVRGPSADSLTTGEDLSRQVTSGVIERSVSDSTSIADAALTRMLSIIRVPAGDTTTVSEVSAFITHSRMLEETMAAGDTSLNRLVMMVRSLSDNVVIGEQVFTPANLAVYATPAEVRPLLGNISSGITDAQISLAVDAATDEINTTTNRQPPNDWQTTDANFELIKKIARYLAAIEASLGIADFEDTRKSMREEVDRMFKMVLDTDQGSDTDFVESSESETYAASGTGIIWSQRYKNLRKESTGDNEQYSFINDIGD